MMSSSCHVALALMSALSISCKRHASVAENDGRKCLSNNCVFEKFLPEIYGIFDFRVSHRHTLWDKNKFVIVILEAVNDCNANPLRSFEWLSWPKKICIELCAVGRG